jgi:hypothetical protein
MRSALALLAGLITTAAPAALAQQAAPAEQTAPPQQAAPAASPRQDAPVPYSAVRALNLARNTAILRNGGLTVYRPAQCMFITAAAGNECLLSNDANGYLFRFLGGPPGWQQLGLPATKETEIRIAPDGRSVVEILYNGAPR